MHLLCWLSHLWHLLLPRGSPSEIGVKIAELASMALYASRHLADAEEHDRAKRYATAAELCRLASGFIDLADRKTTTHTRSLPVMQSPFSMDMSPKGVEQIFKAGIKPEWQDRWFSYPGVQAGFANMFAKAAGQCPPPPEFPEKRGIVMVAGGWKFFASLYVTVKMVRHMGCQLPIEVWYLGDNKELHPLMPELLDDPAVTFVDANAAWRERGFGIYLKNFDHGWMVKPFAVCYSQFAEVLFLDADAYPVTEPDRLFDSQAYNDCGNVFFPDQAVLTPEQWKAFGLEPIEQPACESGQFYVGKVKHWKPLWLAAWLNAYHHYFWRICYGDKDAFTLGFAMCNAPMAFTQELPVLCQASYIQEDFEGKPAFVHRTGAKFVLDADDKGRGVPHRFHTRQVGTKFSFDRQLPFEQQAWKYYQELVARLAQHRAAHFSPGLEPDEPVHP